MFALYNCDTDKFVSAITSRGRSPLHTVSTTQDEDRALLYRDEDRAQDMLERLMDEGALHGDDYRVIEVNV